MARKTMAQLEEERNVAEIAFYDELQRAYPLRLMATLERVTELRCEIRVYGTCFIITDVTDQDRETFEVPYRFVGNDAALTNLEWWISDKLYEIESRKALAEKRQSALNKLTSEERNILGLK